MPATAGSLLLQTDTKARNTNAPGVQPQFLKELQKREHEQTLVGRDGATEADAAIADLIALLQ